MTHTINGLCHPHLLDPSKLIDSQGTPIIEFIFTNNDDAEHERARFVRECINQCLIYGLPEDVIAKLNQQHEKSKKSNLRGLKALMSNLRKVKKNTNMSDDNHSLITNCVKAGAKLIKC